MLATAAATGSLPREEDTAAEIKTRSVSSTVGSVDREEIAEAAADAEADGKSGTDAAAEVVSRSGDRWGAVYDEREYEDFEQALDGSYTGVGISAQRSARGDVVVTGVQPGGPADLAGVRKGDQLRTVDGRRVEKRPVADVVALLRGDRTGAVEGTSVVLGLRRGAHSWTETLYRARLATQAVTVRRLGGEPSAAVLIKVAAFTKGAGTAIRDAVRTAPGKRGSSWTSGPTRADWSPRPSRPPRPSWTADSSPPTTCTASSAPSTPSPAATPTGPWSSSSTAAR